MSTQAVPDTQLGLTNEEIQLLRQGQAALGGGSSSSRAASRASSQGLLLLDSSSLSALGRYFDHLMASIEQRINYLSHEAQRFTQLQYDDADGIIGGADAEIARYTEILQQLDELEVDFDRPEWKAWSGIWRVAVAPAGITILGTLRRIILRPIAALIVTAVPIAHDTKQATSQ
ncbi:ead Ea22 domain-containing protein [Fusarium heterosporum]|uniref:Biogenesis of lysosome-related organelles complex 1 subunit CNL1 n=1 Tax=Fusarium heterosporum TaxID=42747 RepID=A0A8H5TF34_FUSHE|nr:ead Ea22 domain-containing protein [Fusarium heterosporum]